MHEKSVFSKLELLYKSNYYLLAFDIVADSKLEKYIEMDVHKRYADYLYQKNDYDLATQEYCKTIGYVEPSSIIRKVCVYSSLSLLLTNATVLGPSKNT